MKKITFIAFLVMLVFACNSDDGKNKRYSIESGYIIYKMEMMGMTTNISTYFKDYGNIEASITEIERMGQKLKIFNLNKDGYQYVYQEGIKEGMKIKMDDEMVSSEGKMGRSDEKTIEKLGGKKTGTDKVLGKTCNVYEVEESGIETKYWFWNNMLLKMEAYQEPMNVTTEAVELKETSDFPEGIFDLPKDVEFKEEGATETEPETQTDDFDVEGAEG